MSTSASYLADRVDQAIEQHLNMIEDAADFDKNDDACTGAESRLLTQKLGNRIRLDTVYSGTALANPKSGKDRGSQSDRANRAVTEQVLDPRTMVILCKLITNGHISSVNGCISTGKEANVYHASFIPPDSVGKDGSAAIKIYKSTILTFKNRDRYVQGEYRFRHGYCKSNPRKMVGMWAEKEMRNLKRLVAAGIPCPAPRLLKLHVLLMDFVGEQESGIPAPRLKDASFADAETQRPIDWKAVFEEGVGIVRKLFHQCHLVHADFSEYNLLWHQGHLVVIDVGQAVEHEHPHAIDFLKADCANVVRFFGRERGVVGVRSVRRVFEWVISPEERTPEVLYSEDCDMGDDDPMFMQSFVPRSLNQVDHERPVQDRLQEAHIAARLVTAQMEKVSLGTPEPPLPDIQGLSLSEEATSPEAKPETRAEKRAARKANKTVVKEARRERRIVKSANNKNQFKPKNKPTSA